jgi:hypothetical protein
MKNGKSKDEQLLSAEHFKFGGPSLVYLLKCIEVIAFQSLT